MRKVNHKRKIISSKPSSYPEPIPYHPALISIHHPNHPHPGHTINPGKSFLRCLQNLIAIEGVDVDGDDTIRRL